MQLNLNTKYILNIAYKNKIFNSNTLKIQGFNGIIYKFILVRLESVKIVKNIKKDGVVNGNLFR